MLKKIILIVLILGLNTACSQINDILDRHTAVSDEKEAVAQMLYRGLMYGKLEQFKPYLESDLFTHIASDQAHFHELKKIIPKQEVLSRDVYSSKSSLNFIPWKSSTLEVVYHYIYPEQVVVFTVYYDSKTSKIVEFQLEKSPLIVVN